MSAATMPSGRWSITAIEQAADEIVLLNIGGPSTTARSSIACSSAGAGPRAFSNSAGVLLSLPFGADASSYYNAGLSAAEPVCDALHRAAGRRGLLSGVMRSVKIGLLGYYLDNGWPADLLDGADRREALDQRGFLCPRGRRKRRCAPGSPAGRAAASRTRRGGARCPRPDHGYLSSSTTGAIPTSSTLPRSGRCASSLGVAIDGPRPERIAHPGERRFHRRRRHHREAFDPAGGRSGAKAATTSSPPELTRR